MWKAIPPPWRVIQTDSIDNKAFQWLHNSGQCLFSVNGTTTAEKKILERRPDIGFLATRTNQNLTKWLTRKRTKIAQKTDNGWLPSEYKWDTL